MSSNQLNDISKVYMEAVYGGGKKEEKDTRMVVTNADKKANTKAYQNYKAGNKAYKGADHLKDNYEFARHKASIISRGGRLEDAVESWNQKVAYKEAMNNVSEKKEVNVKDTYKTVAAIVDYDRAKKGSKDATYDSMKGDKEGAKKERDYAAWERSKMKKDDPNWKSKKYHTGMHGESYETTKTKEVMGALKKRDLKQDVKKKIAADIVKKKGDTSKSDDRYAYEGYQRDPEGQEKDRKRSKQTDPSKAGFTGIGDSIEDIMKQNAAMKKAAAKKKTGVSEGYGKKKKKKHDCASKVKHEEFGIGNCIPEMHDLDESGNVSHYDVEFAEYIVEGVPAEELEILEGHMHEHVIREKMAAKDYDGDGKIESGKDEYFGSKDKAIKKAMGKKVKKESLSDWRDDLSDLIEIVAGPEDEVEKKVKESNVKNKVVINPKISEAIEEIGGEVLEHHQKDADGNTIPHDDVNEGQVKKEIKALSTAARTLKGRNVAKADKIEEGTGKKNCGCGQDPCITYGEQKEGSRLGKSQVEESEKLAQKAYDRAQKLGAKRRAKQGVNRGVGKSERAGYNLAQAQRSRNTDAATQGGPQTGGGSKSFGYAKNKSNPVKSKSVGDSGQVGHARKRDEKTSVGKSGKTLKTSKYKLSFKDRQTHHTRSASSRRDPKQNPKHTANTQKEENIFSRLMEADKKGKGSGTKDACYNKVKASAKVWPSAYASGRLVQCRKKGAENYGKGSD